MTGTEDGGGTVSADYPVTPEQRRLWLTQQIHPDDAGYNVYPAMRWRGPLSVPALQQAFDRVEARHEILRTRFAADPGTGEVGQYVLAPRGIPLEHLDVDPATADDPAALAALLGRWVNAPFDLARPPLLRPVLLTAAPDHHVLAIPIHHIVTDGWSLGLLLDELMECYEDALADRPDPQAPGERAQFGPYAVSETVRLAGPDGEKALTYWTGRLAGLPVLEPPLDRPRPKDPAHRAAFSVVRLPADLTAAVEQLARAERATVFMVLLAAYQALLSRWTGQDDFGVGTPLAGRHRLEHEAVLGYLTKTVVIRADLDGRPDFATLLRRVRSAVMGAFAHPDLPVEQVVSALGLRGDGSRPPLFQTVLVLQSQRQTAGATGRTPKGVVLEPVESGYDQAKFDLMLDMWRDGDAYVASFAYDRELFEAESVDRLARGYVDLLAAAVADPHRPAGEPVGDDLAEQAGFADGGPLPAHAPTVPEAFAAQAARTPDACAVEYRDTRIAYRELDERSTALAARLAAAGVRDGVVAVHAEPSAELIVRLLAVWKAGAAYLPIDPALPAERVRLMLDRGGARLTLGDADELRAGDGDEDELPAGDGDELPVGADGLPAEPLPGFTPAAPAPGRPAYVLYTSGTTGEPKAVVVPHEAVAARVHWMAGPDGYALAPADRVAQCASAGFDTHVEEIWPALISGARCVVVPGGGRMLPDLLRTPAGAALTVLDLTTAHWQELVSLGLLGDTVAWPPALRLVVLGGSEVTAASVAQWRELHGDAVRLVNTYGPTEATVIATSADLGAADTLRRPPLGRPLPGVRAYVLDERLRPVPPGSPGELCLGGTGLALGYLGRPDLTADLFLPDPYGAPGGRLYRTGDRARWRTDGTLEFLGRGDDQVKIRGYRVEPAEVENVLLGHPDVVRAAVLAHEGALLAFAVVRGGDPAAGTALRDHLAERLPAYQVPAAVDVVTALPLTANGKLDVPVLLAVARSRRARTAEFVAPRTDAEALVAEIWQEVLGVEKAGALDDFFELGGDSLLVTRVVARVRALVEVDLQIRDVFDRPGLDGLAGRIEELLVEEIDGLDDVEAAAALNAEPVGADRSGR